MMMHLEELYMWAIYLMQSLITNYMPFSILLGKLNRFKFQKITLL